MARLLSGSTLRRGGSREFLDLKGAMPQLPPSETTATGFTVATDSLYRTTYRSSLGFIEFVTATMYSALPEGTIRVLATGTSFLAENTYSGNLVIEGGVGIGGNMYVEEDIVVNQLTIGRGYEGRNNLVFRGVASPYVNDFNEGQSSIAIGYDSLTGLITSNKNIAIGRNTLSTGTEISYSIAIGDGALKEIGSVQTSISSTITNVTVIPRSSISSALNSNPLSITAFSHGLSTGTQIFITGVVGLTTGSSSIVNNRPFWIDVTSLNSFNLYVNKARSKSLDGTSATSYVSGGTVTNPAIITAAQHSLSTGTRVKIENVAGMTQLNNQIYWVDVMSSSTVALFTNPILNTPLDATSFTPYSSSGTISKPIVDRNNNIALGVDAGTRLIDGRFNILLGDRVARNLQEGSNNILIGSGLNPLLVKGSGIISIGGGNIVNDVNNQVNIGSVFYYNGRGYASISAETTIGLEINSTSTNSGALVVSGGVGIWKDVNVGGIINVLSAGTSTIASRVDILDDTAAVDAFGGGALYVEGGVSVKGSVHINENLTVIGSGDVDLSPSTADVFLKPGGSVEIAPTTVGLMDNVTIGSLAAQDGSFLDIVGETLLVTNTGSSISTVTGQSAVFDGGIGVQKDSYFAEGIYGVTGNPDENYLVYSPKVSVTEGIAPSGPRVGDIWIDASIPAYLQYIKDGTSTFWIQVGAV
jgi:hypothetical protein